MKAGATSHQLCQEVRPVCVNKVIFFATVASVLAAPVLEDRIGAAEKKFFDLLYNISNRSV